MDPRSVPTCWVIGFFLAECAEMLESGIASPRPGSEPTQVLLVGGERGTALHADGDKTGTTGPGLRTVCVP